MNWVVFCYVWGLLINWFIFVDCCCVCVINVPVTVQCLAAVRCLIGDVISVSWYFYVCCSWTSNVSVVLCCQVCLFVTCAISLCLFIEERFLHSWSFLSFYPTKKYIDVLLLPNVWHDLNITLPVNNLIWTYSKPLFWKLLVLTIIISFNPSWVYCLRPLLLMHRMQL